jgi:hypothetical protein
MRDRLVTQERLFDLRDMAQDGAAEGAMAKLTCRELLQLLDHIDILGAALDVEAGDYCRVCGCTEHVACPEECHWVAEGLCSSCQYQVEPADDGEEGWQIRDLLTGEILGANDEAGVTIYLDRKVAEASALMGVPLYQVAACEACDWHGCYPEATGVCQDCGGQVRGLDEYRAIDGRRLDDSDGIAVLTLDQVAEGALDELLGEKP